MSTTIAEFSRVVAVDAIPDSGRDFEIEASASERDAIAARLGLIGVDSLRAEGRMKPGNRGRDVFLDGYYRAEIRERCVVTLDVFATCIEGKVRSHFSADVDDEWMSAVDEDGERLVDRETDEFVEPLSNGAIDIGEAVVQHLSLEISTYPRKPIQSDEDDRRPEVSLLEGGRQSPFANLGDLPFMRDKKQH